MLTKKNFLWIVLFGSLIGLNETLIGSFDMPYRSVVLSTITIVLLTLARYYFPKTGTSFLIILIAILFKINSIGIHACTSTVLLCGPTVLLITGITYELFASFIIERKYFRYLSYILTCVISSVVIFAVFALLQTYIIKSWDVSRMIQYIFIKGSITAVASAAISVLALYAARNFNTAGFKQLNPYLINSVVGSLIIALWVVGFYSA